MGAGESLVMLGAWRDTCRKGSRDPDVFDRRFQEVLPEGGYVG